MRKKHVREPLLELGLEPLKTARGWKPRVGKRSENKAYEDLWGETNWPVGQERRDGRLLKSRGRCGSATTLALTPGSETKANLRPPLGAQLQVDEG